MITDKDITKLINAFSKIFVTKNELHEFKEEVTTKITDHIAVIDGYSKRFDEQRQECLIVNNYVNRHEKNFVDIRNTIKTASD
jgi:hypothetical protein